MYPVFDIYSFTLYIIQRYSINYVRRVSRCTVITAGNYPRKILLDFSRDIGYRNWCYSVIVFFSPSRQTPVSCL